jgi:hypothetical protein
MVASDALDYQFAGLAGGGQSCCERVDPFVGNWTGRKCENPWSALPST